MAENYVKLTLTPEREIGRPIIAKQFDAASRFLDVTLADGGGAPFDLTNHKVRFNARKPDGRFIFNDAKIVDAKSGRVLIELTDQVLAIGGKTVKADISVFTRDEKCVLTYRTFEIFVEQTQRSDAAIESANEFGAVLKMLQEVTGLYSQVKQGQATLVFDFDNIAALDRVTIDVEYSENAALEVITDTPSGGKIAERLTRFSQEGGETVIYEVTRLFAEDGERIAKEATIRSVFGADKIQQTVEGYDDYTLVSALLQEIRVDGGEFYEDKGYTD